MAPPRSGLRPPPPQGGATGGPAKPVPRWPANFVLALAALSATAAHAESVSLQGMMGGKALLIVNGTAPKTVAPGETHQGVKVLSASGDQAVVEIEGMRHTLRMGDAPASVGSGSGGAGARSSRIVLPVGSGGHFMAQGAINGQAVSFMVDTGATAVSMGVSDAERLGLNYKAGERGTANTANGVVTAWRIRLASVRVGDVEVFDVEAIVAPQPMTFVLLGNSFLNRFQMKRDHDVMVLERRY
jgi:aspartyl protease family protein